MGLFNVNQVIPVVGPGQVGKLFDNETPAAPAYSQSIEYLPLFGHSTTKAWQPYWATAPSAAVVTLQSSNTNVDADFQDTDLSWTFAGTQLVPQVEIGCSRFYRYALKSNADGVGLTGSFRFA